MPTKYKNILKEQKELFQKFYNTVANPNFTRYENIQLTINSLAKNISEYSESEFSREAALSSIWLKVIIDDMNGEITHFFIKDNSLVEFLKNTEVKDTSIVEKFIKEHSSPLKSTNERYYTLAVHSETEGLAFTYLQNNERTIVVVFDNDYTYDFKLGATKLTPLCKMAINFIYYLKAFPEKILDGVPADMVKNDKKKFTSSNCHSVGIADEIVEKSEVINGHLVSPHFRSGFFRHYTDDRYINMKGKVQFIAATMVKGKAKTVVA